MQEEVEGQQQPRHQGHKPAIAGDITQAVAEFLLCAIGPERLEVLVGREMKQHHDGEHFKVSRQ